MAVTDPVDARLLAALAEVGKAAVHELAARVGMDPREVAYRLVALSGSGLPLLVGVESDPHGLRAAIAGAGAWATHGVAGPPTGPHPVHGIPSGPHPVHGAPSGGYPVHGAPSGPYPAHGAPSGPYPPYGPAPQAPPPGYPQQQFHPAPRPPQYAAPPGFAPPRPGPPPGPQFAPPQVPPPQPYLPHAPAPVPQQAPPAPADPVISTWGPPQSSSWARGDQQPRVTPSAPRPEAPRQGHPGDSLTTEGLEGERLSVQLLEVQDPADFLFGAAGYRLGADERAVVVHTEITNHGPGAFAALPDNYLELVTATGETVSKAPVSLASRPAHRIGVPAGETLGGHTVYVLPEATAVTAVRWSPRPDPDERTLTWSLEEQ